MKGKAVKMLVAGSLLAIFVVTVFFLSFAEQKDIRPVHPTVRARTEADLAVTGIYATNCKCDLPEFDMFFMDKVIVRVEIKKGPRVPPGGAVGILTATYRDPITRRNVSNSSMLFYENFEGGIEYETVFKSPVLVRKSSGIRAEITLLPGYADVDINPHNNVMIKNACELQPPILY